MGTGLHLPDVQLGLPANSDSEAPCPLHPYLISNKIWAQRGVPVLGSADAMGVLALASIWIYPL